MRNFKETEFYYAVNSVNCDDMDSSDTNRIFLQFREELFEFIAAETNVLLLYRGLCSAIFELQAIVERKKYPCRLSNKGLFLMNSELDFIKTSINPSAQPAMLLQAPSDIPQSPQLDWTGKKADLVEIVYALYHNGSFGSATMKEVFSAFETMLGVKTHDFYHIFTRIRARKLERCTFLYTLKANLETVMDKMD